MRTDQGFGSAISVKRLKCIYAICEDPSDNFGHLVNVASLNPKKDFRHCDLTNCDFSKSDLRGFDFTGSDLRGAIGQNISWDDSTLFVNANVSGSVFSYEIDRRRLAAEIPTFRQEVERRGRGDWASTTLWVADNVKDGAPNREIAIEISKALLDHTENNFLKSQIIFFLSAAFEQRDKHRDFLIHLACSHSHDLSLHRSAVRLLASLFRSDLYAYRFLWSEVRVGNDPTVQRAAAVGLISSKLFLSEIGPIIDHVSHLGADIRRSILERVAASISEAHLRAVLEPSTSLYLDYDVEIDLRGVELISRFEVFRRPAPLSQFPIRRQISDLEIPIATEKNAKENMLSVARRLSNIVGSGIPLRFTSEVVGLLERLK